MDRITILEIKTERLADAQARSHAARELRLLRAVGAQAMPGLGSLIAQLKAVNRELWDIEDRLRRLERDKDFGPEFVDLARAVYHANDERARLKRAINAATGSALVEEKSYEPY